MTALQVYALLNKKVKGVASGVASHRVEGTNLILTFTDGSSATIAFTQPKDGVSVDRLEFNETTNELLYYLSDGTSGSAGEIPVGKDGLSAYEIAKKNGFVGTEEEWLESLQATGGKIDIIKVNGEVIAINPDDKSVDIEIPIQSISVNKTDVAPDENGNVDIIVPKAPIQSISQNKVALTPDENGNVDIPIADTNKIEIVKQNGVELTIDENKAVDIKADVNKIEVVKVNNTALEIDENKAVNIDLTDYAKTEEVEEYIEEQLYETTATEAYYEKAEVGADGALEVVADDVAAADGQINVSNVTPMLEGETVAAGDYVIYIAASESKTAKYLGEADLDPYVAEDEVKVLTEEEVLALVGLSEEELEGLATVISDTELRIDKTYSSSKIYTELERVLEEGKTYTLEEIAKASGASYKIATSAADMTSTKYIYLLENGDTYDMYICEEEGSTPVKIGTTSVALTDYYNKTECNERFVLATAFALLNNSIGDVTTLQTASKVIVDAINELLATINNNKTSVDTVIGDITTLKTTVKDNVVNAVNEVVDAQNQTKEALGDTAALETTDKTSLVNAVNEVKKSIDEFETYEALTQAEYDALADDETGKLSGVEYRTTDTGKIYKNGVQYGGQEPIEMTYEQYKVDKEAGLIDPDAEYIITTDENGLLLSGTDVGYDNSASELEATTVQGAIDKVAEIAESPIKPTLNIADAENDCNNIPSLMEDMTTVVCTVDSGAVAHTPKDTFATETGFFEITTTRQNSTYAWQTAKRLGAKPNVFQRCLLDGVWEDWTSTGVVRDDLTNDVNTWSSSKIASQISSATAIKRDNTIGGNATVDTGFSLEQRESYFYGRLLQLDGHEGSGDYSYSFLLFVKANYSNPTEVVCKQIVGMYSNYDMEYTRFFELGISDSNTLTITNKSAATASYRFI